LNSLVTRSQFIREAAAIALGCIVDVVLDWLRRRPPRRYRVTDQGIEALTSQRVEISLDDWARLPICELCGRASAMGLDHSDCVVDLVLDQAWERAGVA